jgi:hypothetical protein
LGEPGDEEVFPLKRPGAAIAESVREAWFWAAVFRDHATFLHNGLAPQEKRAADRTAALERQFGMMAEAAQGLARSIGVAGPAGSYALEAGGRAVAPERYSGPELLHYQEAAGALCRQLTGGVQTLKGFKEELLQQKLDCKVALNLGPSLIQHMINEAEEGYRALSGMREGSNLPPALEALHHHLLWLPDAAGHAAALHGGLDAVEQGLLDLTAGFKRTFMGMEIKAVELYAMLRVAPRMAAALRRFNRDAMAEIAAFRTFLAELREHLEGCEVLGSLTPLFADHMLREELYYTEKILGIQEQA